MSFQLAIAAEAHEDISRNASWWAEHHSYEQAIRWKDAVYEQLETLRTYPERHPLASENPEFPLDIREKPIGLGSRPSYRAVLSDRLKASYRDVSVDVVHLDLGDFQTQTKETGVYKPRRTEF